MSYTIPNPLSSGSDILADDVEENFRIARRSLSTLTSADVSSNAIDTDQIVKPDKIFGNHYRCTSGVYIGKTTTADDRDAEYITSHVKQANYTSKNMFVDIANAGASFYLERASTCIILLYAFAYGLANDELSDDGNANEIYMYIDDEQVPESVCYVADYDGSDSGGSPGHEGAERCRWVPVTFMCTDTLSTGWHMVQLKCNPDIEYMLIKNINLVVKCYYSS